MSKAFWIFALIGLVIYYFGRFFYRALRSFGEGMSNMSSGQRPNEKFKPADGNVAVDKDPGATQKKKKDFKGGEYVDYEEV